MAKENQSGISGTSKSTKSNSSSSNGKQPKEKPTIPGKVLPGKVHLESTDPDVLIKRNKFNAT